MLQGAALDLILGSTGCLRGGIKSGQSVETIEADSDRDRWFTAEEAREYGIIDQVIVRRGEMR